MAEQQVVKSAVVSGDSDHSESDKDLPEEDASTDDRRAALEIPGLEMARTSDDPSTEFRLDIFWHSCLMWLFAYSMF